MNFSLRHNLRLKSRLRLRYLSKWKKIQKVWRKLPPGELRDWVKNHTEELSVYSNFNWFYLKQLEIFEFISRFEPRTGNGISLSPDEDKIFELWNQSEFADVFLKNLNLGKSLQSASKATIRQFELHLLIMGRRHIEKVNAISKSYRVQTALGERIRNGKISPLLSTTLHLEGKDLELRTPSLKEMNRFSTKIELALKLIRRFSPDSWERFVTFTDCIIPIKDKEFVSYSHQDHPGVSMINLYDRDFIDLMDDLLHENGHHHLNHFLNLEKLIDEPAELIYYSPWRRNLRPLRGIYHAYFTFFWAFRLFSDLARNDLGNIWYKFSPDETEKIYWRAVEEFHMLAYSFEDLAWARKKGLITPAGWEIIRSQQRELLKMKPKISLWERKLKAHKKELTRLKGDLKKNRKHYRKN